MNFGFVFLVPLAEDWQRSARLRSSNCKPWNDSRSFVLFCVLGFFSAQSVLKSMFRQCLDVIVLRSPSRWGPRSLARAAHEGVVRSERQGQEAAKAFALEAALHGVVMFCLCLASTASTLSLIFFWQPSLCQDTGAAPGVDALQASVQRRQQQCSFAPQREIPTQLLGPGGGGGRQVTNLTNLSGINLHAASAAGKGWQHSVACRVVK